MKESTVIKGSILFLGFITIMLIAVLDSSIEETAIKESKTDSLSYYKILAKTYKDYYEKSILDPAVRIKLIMGMPEDSAITWVRKCHYNINSKALLKWRPDGKP